MTLSPGYRFEATQALRQVLHRAVAWGMIDVNPAKVGVDNPVRRRKEQHPFESWTELEGRPCGRLPAAAILGASNTRREPGSRPHPRVRRKQRPAASVVTSRSSRNASAVDSDQHQTSVAAAGHTGLPRA